MAPCIRPSDAGWCNDLKRYRMGQNRIDKSRPMNKRLQEIPLEVASLSSTCFGHGVVDRADAPIDVPVSIVFFNTVALRYDSALAPSPRALLYCAAGVCTDSHGILLHDHLRAGIFAMLGARTLVCTQRAIWICHACAPRI